MRLLTAVAVKSETPLTELLKMDVFDFFALLSAVEKTNEQQIKHNVRNGTLTKA